MSSRLLTVLEASEVLGINKNLVYSLINHGHLTALKLGSLKVTSIELEDFLIRNNGMDFSDLNKVVPLRVGKE